MIFTNRDDAGRRLAATLGARSALAQKDKDRLLVVSIPRGGAVIGDAVARILGCDHDVVIVKKIGFPGHEELAVGAMAEDGKIFLDTERLDMYELSMEDLAPVISRTKAKIDHYIDLFRKGRPLELKDKIAIVVDDGIATGETMKAAVRWMKSQEAETRPAKVIVAAPVCSPHSASELRHLSDELVCLATPREFVAVGQFYHQFGQITDAEVIAILRRQKIA